MTKENDFEEADLSPARAVAAESFHRPSMESIRAGLRAWAYHTFSAASLWAGLKALAWVAPLSVFIWIYAEREQVAVSNGLTFNVQVRSVDASRVVRFSEPFDGKVRGDFSGPQGGLEQVREKLESGTALQIELRDGDLTPGQHSIVSTRVNEDAFLVRNGISVSNCMPHDLNVFVDTVEEIDVDVQPPPDAKNIVGTPSFEPRKVKITGPHSVLNSNRLMAYPDLSSIHGAMEPGTHDLPSVPVIVPISDAHVSASPTAVSAHYEVKKSDASYTIPAIPIWVVYPPGMEDKYKAVYEPFLANVTVTGPEAQIKALRDPAFEPKPKATFEINPDDANSEGQHDRRLQFELPQGIQVSAEDAKRAVQFKLVERRLTE